MSGILFDRARSSPDPGWRTIGELAGEAAERFADREFLRFPGASLSFAAAHAASNRLPMTPSARIQKTKLLEQDRDQRAGVFDAAANTWV